MACLLTIGTVAQQVQPSNSTLKVVEQIEIMNYYLTHEKDNIDVGVCHCWLLALGVTWSEYRWRESFIRLKDWSRTSSSKTGTSVVAIIDACNEVRSNKIKEAIALSPAARQQLAVLGSSATGFDYGVAVTTLEHGHDALTGRHVTSCWRWRRKHPGMLTRVRP